MENSEERLPLKSVWKMVGPAFAGTKLRYTGIIIFLAISSLSSIAEPLLYGRVIDRVVEAVNGNTLSALWNVLLPLLLAWVCIDIVGSAAREIANVLSWKTADKVWSRFARTVIRRVLWWDPERFSVIPVGGLTKQLDTAGNAVWRLSGTSIQQLFPIFFGSAAFFVVGSVLDWRMTIASLAGIPLLFFMSFFAQRAVEKKQNLMNEAWEEYLQKLVEILSNIIPIKSFAAEERMTEMYLKLGDEAMERQKKVNTLWATLSFSTSFARFFGRFVLLGSGLYFISQGTLSLGTLVTFMGMLDIVLAPFEHMLADLMRKLSETRSAFARVYPELQKENAIQEQENARPFKKIKGEIVLENLSYRYPEKDKDALTNISLTIPAGTSLALVGTSGSGKSTFVKFLNRFLDPTSGSVSIDGKNVKDIRLTDLRKAIGFVHQESVLFNESIFDNLKFAKPNATRAEVVAACKQAQAHEFIARLAEGYDTIIGGARSASFGR